MTGAISRRRLGRRHGEVTTAPWHIYVITCLVDGRQYVGITSKNPIVRFGWHFAAAERDKPTPLHAAMRDHGSMTFTIEHLACCNTKSDALAVESLLIESLGTRAPNGFNVGGRGGQLSPEQVAQMSARERTPEARARRREVNFQRWAKPTARAKFRAKIRETINRDPDARAARLAQLDAARAKRKRGPGARLGRRSSHVRDPRQGGLL